MKEYLLIKEFAALSGVEQSTLLYWDEIGLFCPAERNPENNYRYYKPAQLIPLNFVTTLSELEVPLKTINELEKDRSPERFIALLDSQEKIINAEMRQLRIRYSIIHAHRELVSFGMRAEETQIGVYHRDERIIGLGPRNEYKEGETFVDALAPLVREARDLHINLSFPIGGYFDSLESFVKAPQQPDHFFTIDPIGTRTIAAGDYLVGSARGDYGEFGDLPQRMAAYAEENNIAVSGPLYAIYLQDEMCIQDHNQYLVQCCVAVSKPKRQPKKDRR